MTDVTSQEMESTKINKSHQSHQNKLITILFGKILMRRFESHEASCMVETVYVLLPIYIPVLLGTLTCHNPKTGCHYTHV